MKACTHCKEVKSLDEYHRAAKASDGRASWCKPCANSIYRERRKRSYDPADKKRWQLKTRYGLTSDDVVAMREKQDGKCGICRVPLGEDVRPCIDHSHTTGAVRGILCHKCNIKLHSVEDGGYLSKALAYLESYK
jgi:Recombination endonuclease VII